MDTLSTLELIHYGVVNMKIKQSEINVTTGEEKVIEITLTEEQEREILVNRQRTLTEQAEAEAKAQAKAAAEGKLAALGLTTDDLRALGL